LAPAGKLVDRQRYALTAKPVRSRRRNATPLPKMAKSGHFRLEK